MTTNEEKLKESLETRRPVLFLGAGFSLKATSGSGCPLMVGSDLAKGLYNYVIKSQKDALAADGADTEAIEGVQSDAERGRLKEVCNFIDDYDLQISQDFPKFRFPVSRNLSLYFLRV